MQSKYAWSHKKRRMRIVKRRVEDLKNRFEEYRVTNEQQKVGNERKRRSTMVEKMQEWLQKYALCLKYISWRSIGSFGPESLSNDPIWNNRVEITLKSKKKAIGIPILIFFGIVVFCLLMLALCFICRAYACGSITYTSSADPETTLALTDLAIRSEMHTEKQREKINFYFQSRLNLNLIATETIVTDETVTEATTYATIKRNTAT